MRAVLVLALLLAMPAAAAQELTDPVVDRALAKVDSTGQDPNRFVHDHARKDSLERESEWGVAYACFVIDHAERHHGTPDPQLQQCERYEQALGLEPEPAHNGSVAIAENLTSEPVDELRGLADAAQGTVQNVSEAPASALDEVRSFLAQAVGAVRRLVSGATRLVSDALTTGLAAATALAHGALGAVEFAAGTVMVGARASAAAGTGVLGTLDRGVEAIDLAARWVEVTLTVCVAFVADVVGDAADAAQDVGANVAGVVADMGNAIGDAWAALFGGGADGDPGALDGVPADPGLDDGLDLPDLGNLVGELL